MGTTGIDPQPAALLNLAGAAPGAADDVEVWAGARARGEGAWAAVERVARSVRPGGRLFFPMRNRLWSLCGPLSRAMARLALAAGARSPLRDWDADARALPAGTWRGCRARLRALGFEEPSFLQLFPNRRETHLTVPLEHRGVVDYFLSHLLPRKTGVQALLAGAARWANRLGPYGALLPVVGVLVRRKDDGDAGAGS